MPENLTPLLLRLQDVARKRLTIPYSAAAELVGLDMSSPYDRKRIGEMLGELSEREHEQGRPMISAVVVTAGAQSPGKGFFNLARRLGLLTDGDEDLFFVEELRRVHEYWSAVPHNGTGPHHGNDTTSEHEGTRPADFGRRASLGMANARPGARSSRPSGVWMVTVGCPSCSKESSSTCSS